MMTEEARQLDLLAATQIIADAEVAHCWELVRVGIQTQKLGTEHPGVLPQHAERRRSRRLPDQARAVPPLPIAAQAAASDPDAVGDLVGLPQGRHRGLAASPAGGLAARHLRGPARALDAARGGERVARHARHAAPAPARRLVDLDPDRDRVPQPVGGDAGRTAAAASWPAWCGVASESFHASRSGDRACNPSC